MSAAAGHRQPKCHVLNFSYDKKENCELTVFINSVRVHIDVNAEKFKAGSGPAAKLGREYRELLSKVKEADEDFSRPCSKENLRNGGKKQDSGTRDTDGDNDSGIDMSEGHDKIAYPVKQAPEDPEKTLSDWMLKPFGAIFAEKAPASGVVREQSVQDWYRTATLFFDLEFENGQLVARELEATIELEQRMSDIVPRMHAPKYIRTDNILWYRAEQLTVLEEDDMPPPYHPSLVKVGEETFFLKMIDPTQPQPFKREIQIMRKIEKLGLHEKLRVPLVKGLVGFEDSKTEMMGFLQTVVEDPIPLTKLLDDDVPQRKRDLWAKESERMKNLLHEHKIIWGDAKADNFLVDKHDNLWIIDFGGSFTEGWVDEELMETEEGDDMGVARIVNALHDPSANTFDPDEGMPPAHAASLAPHGRKRKTSQTTEDDTNSEAGEQAEEEAIPRKRVRTGTATELKHEQSESEEEEEVVESPGAPFKYQDLELDDSLRPDEAHVRIKATGICPDDMMFATQDKLPDMFPCVMGHEGAGIVQAVGDKVTAVQPGDHVVIVTASCGECEYCERKLPAYCDEWFQHNCGMGRADGSKSFRLPKSGRRVCSHFFGQSSFAQDIYVKQTGLVKVPKDVPFEKLAPLACGFMVGAGAMLNVVQPISRMTVVVAGTGSVGLGAIMALKMLPKPPKKIIAVDILPSRLEVARSMGATHGVNNKAHKDLMQVLMHITGGAGIDASIDTTGENDVIQSLVHATARKGKVVTIGTGDTKAEVTLNLFELVQAGCTYIGTQQGDAYPRELVPRLITAYNEGKFPYDKLTRTYPAKDVEQAILDMRSGKTIKPVLLWD
ncbi:hypothetical protein LTR64_001131 [Lithohypha guttulata]|uniref:Enoyl reductase (ER) domain-containing protein n=1 Tax=Lithohypha guttulata TaxID=1690604 RepID=A0AAN7YBQ7_9EURO|nr:hypothetical protein LTR51_003325 [Lithohypha guttulata]KAK5087150.1 hypothetical protein LTR05_004321 [Lithohypha guttulata]